MALPIFGLGNGFSLSPDSEGRGCSGQCQAFMRVVNEKGFRPDRWYHQSSRHLLSRILPASVNAVVSVNGY